MTLLASGPRFTTWDLIVIAAFLLDLAVAPLSALLLVIALGMRRGGWPRLLLSVAAINLVLGGVLALSEPGGPLVTALLAGQALLAAAVIGVLRHPPARVRVFGEVPRLEP